MNETTTSLTPISSQIWQMKYRYGGEGADGKGRDANIQATWSRIARALAAPEADAVRRDIEERSWRRLPVSASCRPAGSSRAPGADARSPSSTAS